MGGGVVLLRAALKGDFAKTWERKKSLPSIPPNLVAAVRLDGRPLKIREFVAHDSRLHWELESPPGTIINLPRPS
jgi:hypothetical protein